jgi:GDPmannose 4,6-dehydratase
VTRKVTHAAAAISLGLTDELRLGDLDARRDWSFAGDCVEAMWLMLQQDQADDYVVSSGVSHSVRELVECAFSSLDLDWEPYVKVDSALVRPQDPTPLVGDSTKARERLGWEPKVSFEELIPAMVEADRRLLSGEMTPIRA